MNGKRLLLMAAFGALATIAMPSAFASTVTNTITVKWNTQAITTLTVVTDYANVGSAQAASQGASTPVYLTGSSPAGGTGSCGGASTAETAQVANFQNVTPDTTTHYQDCLYPNGANAFVATTDALGYSLTVAGTLPKSCGAADCAGGPYILCLLTNGTWSNVTAGNGAVVSTRSGSAPLLDNGGTHTCASNTGIVMATTTGTGGTILPSTAATTAGTNYGGDIELGVPPLASSGAQAVTVTYTLTLN
jgi:hypothetical protein